MSRRKIAGQEREQVRAAQEKARKAVACWSQGRLGAGPDIQQERIGQAIGRDLSAVVRRYPLAVRKDGRKNVWNMPALEKSLRFDDPVTMLGKLAPANAGTWGSLLEQVQKEGCSPDQEASIRSALFRMMLPVNASIELADDSWSVGWSLYRENLLRRKS